MKIVYNTDNGPCHPKTEVGARESFYSAENDMGFNAIRISDNALKYARAELDLSGFKILQEEDNRRHSLFVGGIYNTTVYGISGGSIIYNELQAKNEEQKRVLPSRDLTIFSPTREDLEKVKKKLHLEEIE